MELRKPERIPAEETLDRWTTGSWIEGAPESDGLERMPGDSDRIPEDEEPLDHCASRMSLLLGNTPVGAGGELAVGSSNGLELVEAESR